MLQEQKSPAPNVITDRIVRNAMRRSNPAAAETDFAKTEVLWKNVGN
jgi:hypothetical protein